MANSREYQRDRADMDWDGAVNARLIGGSVYRMGRREWLSERGWQQLRAAGIKTIIDLRNPGEIRRRPRDPLVSDSAFQGLGILNMPLEREGNARFEKVAVPYMNHPSMYRLVCEEFPDLIRDVFRQLATGEGGTVVHCSAGRDRSGLVATLLLDLSGRGDEAVAHDALGTRGINEWHRVSGYPHPYERYQTPHALEPVLSSRAAALEEFLSWLGSADQFLSAAGVSSAELERLRARVMLDGGELRAR